MKVTWWSITNLCNVQLSRACILALLNIISHDCKSAFIHKNAYEFFREDFPSVLSQEDPLEKEMATHLPCSSLGNPWTGKPGRLQSMGSVKKVKTKTSPSTTRDVGLIPGGRAKIPHALQPKTQNIKSRNNTVTNSMKSLKNGPQDEI